MGQIANNTAESQTDTRHHHHPGHGEGEQSVWVNVGGGNNHFTSIYLQFPRHMFSGRPDDVG